MNLEKTALTQWICEEMDVYSIINKVSTAAIPKLNKDIGKTYIVYLLVITARIVCIMWGKSGIFHKPVPITLYLEQI